MNGLWGFVPNWPAPANIGAFITCRDGGYSRGPYRSNNLGAHVGDDPQAVASNRRQLSDRLGIGQPCWLQQVHGTRIVDAANTDTPSADGSISGEAGQVCAILTADCLPLLLCDRLGRQVAAVHCGWRGLADGIIGRALAAFHSAPGELLAYLGPAISGRHYEVGSEVKDALAASVAAEHATFSQAVADKPGHFLLDLYAVARAQLFAQGVRQIHGGDRCTFAEADAFYSYRRDGVTGRMASLIWINPNIA